MVAQVILPQTPGARSQGTLVWTLHSGQWTGHYLLIRAISHRIFIRLNNMSSPLMIVVLQLPSLMKWYNITTS